MKPRFIEKSRNLRETHFLILKTMRWPNKARDYNSALSTGTGWHKTGRHQGIQHQQTCLHDLWWRPDDLVTDPVTQSQTLPWTPALKMYSTLKVRSDCSKYLIKWCTLKEFCWFFFMFLSIIFFEILFTALVNTLSENTLLTFQEYFNKLA